jgi:hypothetical protein
VIFLLDQTKPADATELGAENAVDLGNREGRTCLHIAALKNNFPLTTYLVEQQQAEKRVLWHHRVRLLYFILILSSYVSGL